MSTRDVDQMKTEGSVHLTPNTVEKNVGVNPTPKTVQKNVGFNPTSIWGGIKPNTKQTVVINPTSIAVTEYSQD